MAQKRIICDMTWEEIEALYHNNTWLRNEINWYIEKLQTDKESEISWYLSKNKYIKYEFGGYCDTIEAEAGHIAEYIDIAEKMYNDGVINLPCCSSASFCWSTVYNLATKCDEYEREGFTTDPRDEFFEPEYLNTCEELQDFLSAIESAIIEELHDSIDYTYALELWRDDFCDKYASDGKYIYELEMRIYA